MNSSTNLRLVQRTLVEVSDGRRCVIHHPVVQGNSFTPFLGQKVRMGDIETSEEKADILTMGWWRVITPKTSAKSLFVVFNIQYPHQLSVHTIHFFTRYADTDQHQFLQGLAFHCIDNDLCTVNFKGPGYTVEPPWATTSRKRPPNQNPDRFLHQPKCYCRILP